MQINIGEDVNFTLEESGVALAALQAPAEEADHGGRAAGPAGGGAGFRISTWRVRIRVDQKNNNTNEKIKLLNHVGFNMRPNVNHENE